MQQQHKPHLLRGLNARHIRFIALGSAIGTGLFYGSASAIKAAGPAVLLAYLIGGAAVFIVMRALGEMAVRNPVSGSFGSYARQYLGPLAGFITGWTYTFEMVIVALADVTAFGIYMGLWYPDVPRWIWILSIIFFIGAMNLCNVRVFGEMEFWLSLVKVVAIIAMMLAGAGIIFFGFGHSFPATGLENLWSHGGFAPNGWQGVIAFHHAGHHQHMVPVELGRRAGQHLDAHHLRLFDGERTGDNITRDSPFPVAFGYLTT